MQLETTGSHPPPPNGVSEYTVCSKLLNVFENGIAIELNPFAYIAGPFMC